MTASTTQTTNTATTGATKPPPRRPRTPHARQAQHSQHPKPAIFKAISWFIFAGTATFTAIFLPAHIIALINNKSLTVPPQLTDLFQLPSQTATYLTTLITAIFIAILIFSTLYHSLYRINTTLLDLGFPKTARIINFTNTIIVLIVTGFLIYSVFTTF